MDFTEVVFRGIDAQLAQGDARGPRRVEAERPFTLDEPFARVPMAEAVADGRAATKIAAWLRPSPSSGGAGSSLLLRRATSAPA